MVHNDFIFVNRRHRSKSSMFTRFARYYTYEDLRDFTLVGACCVAILHSHVVERK